MSLSEENVIKNILIKWDISGHFLDWFYYILFSGGNDLNLNGFYLYLVTDISYKTTICRSYQSDFYYS